MGEIYTLVLSLPELYPKKQPDLMDFSAKLHLIMSTAQGEEALLLPGYVVCCFIFSLYVIDSQTSITHIPQPC